MSSLLGVIIEETETFAKAVKQLQKRFKNVETDCDEFVHNIKIIDNLGVNLGSGVYKVRIANSDKKSGKSSGYRLISYLKLIDNKLYLMYVYDKSDLGTVSEKQIDALIKKTILEKTNKE
ncbi:MAG: type II toxin-antitoxin system RelE/ParE family toxin [Sulfurimonas sp.]|uniref:type II toxin-antitoxin system RelE/ParE family toxin n=1 Tax=Sulfurimonas sp. TaxID=2022749 RepID=UPI003D12E50F